MRRRVTIIALVFAAGCAEILGIDDGTPRTYDAGADATLDASVDAKKDDVVVIDAFSPLSCGSTTCDFGKGESCCWLDGGFSCVSSPGQCTFGIDIPCDRPEQCPQDAGPAVCCATYANTDAGAVATSVACADKNLCATGSSRFIVCDDDSSADCPPDASCGLSAISLPTYLICKP